MNRHQPRCRDIVLRESALISTTSVASTRPAAGAVAGGGGGYDDGRTQAQGIFYILVRFHSLRSTKSKTRKTHRRTDRHTRAQGALPQTEHRAPLRMRGATKT